jgi:hypothetical protein
LQQEQLARHILQLLFRIDEALAPEYVSVGSRWDTVNQEAIEELARWWPQQKNISLERRRPFQSAAVISMWPTVTGGYSSFFYWLSARYVGLPHGLPNFLGFANALYELLRPTYGNIHPTQDALAMATIHDPKYGKTIIPTELKKGLPAVYWGNFFGPDYVSLISKSTMQQVSALQTFELSDGGVLVLTTSTPLEIDHDLQAQIRDEIGHEFFFEWGKTSPARVP